VTRGSVRHITIDSGLLRGNPLGDPHVRDLPIYVPPGYDADQARHYPVVFFLAGYTSSGPSLLSWKGQGWGENTQSRMDRMINAGEMPPMIGVFPDCWTRWGGSQYLDSTATGPYMRHIVEELVPAVDDGFRTLRQSGSRAVAGTSSGGYGALMLAMERPGVFGIVAATAADTSFDLCYRPDLPKFVGAIEQAGGVEPFIERFFSTPKLSGDQITAMMIIANSACYSPNLSKPPIHADLPVDLYTAELIPEVWDRWLAKDPVRRIKDPDRAGALAELTLLSLDAGRRDEYHLQFGHRALGRALSRADVPFVSEEFDDGHRGISYRQEHALRRIGAAIATEAQS